MVLPVPGGGNEGGGDRADLDIDPPEAEHGHAIYCDSADSGPVRGGSKTAGVTGPNEMVGADRDRLEGAREKASATEEESAESAETELTGSDLETKADTPEGAVCGTGGDTSLRASGSSEAEWKGAED